MFTYNTDPASLDYHMDVAGPRFGRFADLVTLRSIHIYGEPSEAVARLRDKVRLLGTESDGARAARWVRAVALSERPAPAIG